jgi:hypothetical protein
LLELHYGQDYFDFLRKEQEPDIQADFKGIEMNGIPNDKEKKIMASGNSRKKETNGKRNWTSLFKKKREKN